MNREGHEDEAGTVPLSFVVLVFPVVRELLANHE